jgi:hypothetical protein
MGSSKNEGLSLDQAIDWSFAFCKGATKLNKELTPDELNDCETYPDFEKHIKKKFGDDIFYLILSEALKFKKVKDDNNSIKHFLLESRPKFESLGCGFHNEIYYFGTRLWKDGVSYTGVVTNEPKVYLDRRVKVGNEWVGENEIKTKFGLNYKDDFYDEPLDFIFTGQAIDRYLFGDTSNITLANIFDQLVELLKQYMYFEDDTRYKVVALYRICGFFMPVWDSRARLFIHAEFGSAKSRLTQILHNLGFNSVSLGDWTLAFLQRMIESSRGEAHIDDFETLDEEKKKATIRLVKTGYMKGFKAGKTSDKSRRPEVYDLFNTTTINNTEGLDFISNDRCLTIRIPKIADSKYDKDPDFKELIWGMLRDKLYILGLKEAENVAEAYPKITSKKINGRLLSIIKPELTIAKLISTELFYEVEGWWAEEIEQRDSRDLDDDWGFRAFEKIYSIVVGSGDEDYFYLYDSVVLPLILEMYGELEIRKYKFKMSSVIGGQLRRSPIFKNRKVAGKSQYKVKKDDLIKLLKAKRMYKQIVSYASTHTTNTTNTTNTTHSTEEVVGDVVDGVECVEGVEQKTRVEHSQNVSFENNEKHLLIYLETNPENNAEEIDRLFSKDLITRAKREGLIYENPRGTYRKV